MHEQRRHGVPRTGSSGAKLEGAAETKRQQNAEERDPTARTATSRAEEAAGPATARTVSSEDKRRPHATDWIIRGGSSSRSRCTPDWIFRRQGAARRPGLEQSGTSGGQMPRKAASGTEQGAKAAAPQNGSSGDKPRPNATDWIIRG